MGIDAAIDIVAVLLVPYRVGLIAPSVPKSTRDSIAFTPASVLSCDYIIYNTHAVGKPFFIVDRTTPEA